MNDYTISINDNHEVFEIKSILAGIHFLFICAVALHMFDELVFPIIAFGVLDIHCLIVSIVLLSVLEWAHDDTIYQGKHH